MSRSVQIVLLCEDRQHEAFARRFLKKIGKDYRVQRVERVNPKGRGSGEQFVRERFKKELEYYRLRKHRVGQALIVLIDADTKSNGRESQNPHERVMARIRELESAAETRKNDECVIIFVPARNIETWLAYLEGQTVNENKVYPHLKRERDCQHHVDCLFEMCQEGILRQPAPTSLEEACREYRMRLKLL